ncbi:MAG: polyprenyl synthetase family protein [Candidatus Micrarchaeia archaeon]
MGTIDRGHSKSWQDEAKSAIKKEMLGYIKSYDPSYYKNITAYIDRGGHYTRPLLFLAAAKAFGAEEKEIVKMAATIEMSEEAILIFDDLQDHSLLRRGGPTLNSAYGYEIASNYAAILEDATRRIFEDYLLSLNDKDVAVRLKAKFDEIAGITAYGQYLELEFTHIIKDPSKVDESYYYNIVKGKTAAYSLYGPIDFAAIIAKQNDEVIKAIEDIGMHAGIAFQIHDDLLDVLASERLGKERFGDLYEGKYTLIIAHAYDSACKKDKALIKRIYAKSREEKDDSDIAELLRIIKATGSLQYALAKRDDEMRSAIALIGKYAGILPSNEYSIKLMQDILGVIARDPIDIMSLLRNYE